jgi:hypothetical protein
MKYFGTSTIEHGHYSWDLSGEVMKKIGLLPKDTPFNPEELTKNLPAGETIFYQGGGFTVFGIAGSCIDDRPNTKSIFWVKEICTKGTLIMMINQNKHSCKIIQSIKFPINW